ncbi:MAG: iron-sulfur cluster assembly scaffold protein [bacterium]|nr:iron-sulfur cluster assembly scaffold protein [bacterium]
MNSIYREEILEHYRDPQNFGKLKNFDISSKQLNPFCGDEIEIFIRFENKSWGVNNEPPQGCTISEVSFMGKGCAICIAACSILTEFVKGKTEKQLTKFSEKDMLDLLGIELSETRKKCGFLALCTLKDCLKNGKI